MKTNKAVLKKLMIAVMAMAISLGCSKKTMQANDPINSSPSNNNGSNTNSSTNVSYNFSSGASAVFHPDSLAVLNSYAGRSVTSPTNFAVNLDVFNVNTSGTPQYGGTFKLAYTENGQTIMGTFNSGTSIFDTQYNKSYTTGGTVKYKLFFQDNLGGIIVIIKQVTINDLQVTYQGDVYFRNFDFGTCANPPPWMAPSCNSQSSYKCWNISAGPYDCRAFLSGSSMRPDIVDLPGFGDHQSGYKGPGWQHLGTFYDMNIQAALNQ